MARVETKVKICDRCGFGNEKDAEETVVVSIDGSYYELELCAEHATAFDRQICSWTRLGREIDPPVRPQQSLWAKQEAARKTEKLREAAAATRQAQTANFVAEQELERMRTKQAETLAAHEKRYGHVAEALEFTQRAIPGAYAWGFSTHAEQRMTEREFGYYEVLEAVCKPEFSYTDHPGRGANVEIRQRGTCRVVVNTVAHTIITVMDRDLSEEPQHAAVG